MTPTFRSGTVNDATACGQICYEAFKAIAEQHNFPPDVPSADMAVGLLSMILARADVNMAQKGSGLNTVRLA